jgi:hypothetical protein
LAIKNTAGQLLPYHYTSGNEYSERFSLDPSQFPPAMAVYSLSSENRISLLSSLSSQPSCSTVRDVAALVCGATDAESRHNAALAAFLFLDMHEEGGDSVGSDDDPEIQGLANLIAAKLISTPAQKESLTAEAALATLGLLHQRAYVLDEASLLAVLSYTDAHDSWTTQEASCMAIHIMQKSLPGDKLDDFIVQYLLQRHFRPLFSRSTSKLTAAGRPSYYDDGAGPASAMLQTPSWKSHGNELLILSRFSWTVANSTEQLIASQWPLFTPPFLSLIEDDQTAVRQRGLETLCVFLGKCSPLMLESSGMRRVLQDAVFPTLMFLPTVTPEKESVRLLRPAYEALLLLSHGGSSSTAANGRPMLDRLLREGIFAGYYHTPESPLIVEVLMKYTATIVQQLGISAVKHLHDLISLFSSIMLDPFALAYPPSVLAVTEALNATLVNCWPRVSAPIHTEEILHCLTVCWLRTCDAEASSQPWAKEIGLLKKELTSNAAMLQGIWLQQNPSPPPKMIEVIKQEPSLVTLFPLLDVGELVDE